MPAPVKTLVDWGDVVRTGEGGRARVSLDDGSVLNVGSSSSLTLTQHDAKAQQTQIELEYGRMRTQVVKQSKPNSKFEVHTTTGVAGVVGTDFATIFLNGIFHLTVYDGTVKFCNLDNVCVTVTGGMMSTIRDGHQPPDPPSPATPSELTDTANATSVGLMTAELPSASPRYLDDYRADGARGHPGDCHPYSDPRKARAAKLKPHRNGLQFGVNVRLLERFQRRLSTG